MTVQRQIGLPYLQHEITVRPVEGGWRVFPVTVDERGPVLAYNVWELPVLPTKRQAIELGCLIVWEYLDLQEVFKHPPGEKPGFRPIDLLE